MKFLEKLFPYMLTSLAVIGIWKLNTWTENYAWFPKGKEELMLNIALTSIFAYKTAFWLIIANLSVFTIKCIYKNNYKAVGVAAFTGLAFYFFAGQVVYKKCASFYYMVFVNQSVTEEYIQYPIQEAGYHIGPILIERIRDKQMRFRRYAIGGLGDIDYKPAEETLRQILFDRTEPDYIREDAYRALVSLDCAESKIDLAEFKLSTANSVDRKEVR